MAIGETVRLRHCRNGVWVGGKVHAWCFLGYGLHLSTPLTGFRQFEDAVPRQLVWAGLPVFPPIDGGEGYADEFRKLRLRQAFRLAEVFDFFAIFKCRNRWHVVHGVRKYKYSIACYTIPIVCLSSRNI